MNWFRKAEVTVESIVAPLSGLVESLRAHIQTKSQEAARHYHMQQHLESLRTLALEEVKKAEAAAEKIAGLLS